MTLVLDRPVEDPCKCYEAFNVGPKSSWVCKLRETVA